MKFLSRIRIPIDAAVQWARRAAKPAWESALAVGGIAALVISLWGIDWRLGLATLGVLMLARVVIPRWVIR